jgi:hypothetical protein
VTSEVYQLHLVSSEDRPVGLSTEYIQVRCSSSELSQDGKNRSHVGCQPLIAFILAGPRRALALPAEGTPAPDFVLPSNTGSDVSLKDLLSSKKYTVREYRRCSDRDA